MANNLAETLNKKKKELTEAFIIQKKSVAEIDSQLAELQLARQQHLEEMARIQGEHRLAESLLAEQK